MTLPDLGCLTLWDEKIPILTSLLYHNTMLHSENSELRKANHSGEIF